MSSLSPDPAGASRPDMRPAQVLLNSPLAAAPRMLGYQAWRRPRPPMAWQRVIAWVGSLLAQLVFLFAFVLGPAYEPPPAQAVPPAKMQVRFVAVPDVTPPKGEVPRKIGPVHRGSAAAPGATSAAARALPARAPLAPAKTAAAPKPTPSLPQVAADLSPVQVSAQTPPIALPVPTVQPPVPPKFQPKPLRAPQAEGNQPIPPPPSLALPDVPTPSAPKMAIPSPALDRIAPPAPRPMLAPAIAVALPPAAPEATLQAVPVAAPKAPTVNLDATALNKPSMPAPQPLAKPQAPKLDAPIEAPLAAIPTVTPTAPAIAAPVQATVKLAHDAGLGHVEQAVAPVAAVSRAEPAAGSPTAAGSASDVSSAPNANAQGRNDAVPGVAQGTAQSVAAGQRPAGGSVPSGAGPGSPSGSKSASASGVPDYVQLKPTGDATIMEHKIKGIGYKPTQFDPYWTPEGESSVDTALRRAAEKTTIKHTFHLPRGIRIECSVMPLVPVALLGCKNPDPPPPPQPQKLYDRLNQPSPEGGAVPRTATPAPSASAAKPGAPVELGNAALCAAARVSGGPLPPGCPPPDTPSTMKPVHPANASSSWAPASDQFH